MTEAADNNVPEVMKPDALEYQLSILKHELETIAEIIGRIDRITQTMKNWSIVTWAGSVGLALKEPELRHFILLTAVLPVLFWLLDGWWRKLQNRTIYRSRCITQFLNSDRLLRSYEAGKLVEFTVFDPVAVTHRSDTDYASSVSLARTLFFPEVAGFHLSLVVVSVILSIVVRS